jgi:hypothetical protein
MLLGQDILEGMSPTFPCVVSEIGGAIDLRICQRDFAQLGDGQLALFRFPLHPQILSFRDIG